MTTNLLNPNFASYGNIRSAIAAVPINDILYIATANTLYQVHGATITLVATLPSPISSMVEFQGKLLLASPSGIWELSDGKFSPFYLTTGHKTCGIASDGSVISYLLDNAIYVLSLEGKVIGVKTESGFVQDIAILGDRLYVVGYTNQKHNGTPVQSCYLHCYEIPSMKLLWKAWDFAGAQLGNDMADSRLYHVATHGNYIAVLGESAGGNTVFRWNGQDLSTNTLVTFDQYNDPYNLKDAHVLYYGLVDANNGKVVRGQFSIPRNSYKGNIGNSNRDRSLSFDGEYFYIGSAAAYEIAERDTTKFLGKVPPPYAGDAAFLKVPVDMKTREWFTPGSGDIVHFGDRFGVFNTSARNIAITGNGTQSALVGVDSYIVEW